MCKTDTERDTDCNVIKIGKNPNLIIFRIFLLTVLRLAVLQGRCQHLLMLLTADLCNTPIVR